MFIDFKNNYFNWITFNKDYLLFAPILLIAIFLRAYNFNHTYGLYGDQGQDLIATDLWIKTGEIPLVGILTSIGTFHMGPLYYYFITPFAVLFNGDSIAPVYFFLISGILLVVTSFIFGLKFVDFHTAFILSFLIAISPHAIFVSKGAYSPNLQIFMCMLVLTSLLQFFKTNKHIFLFLTYLLIGIGAQFHYNFLANAVIVLIIITIFKKGIMFNIKFPLSIFLGLAIPFIPFLIGQISLDYADLKGIYHYLINLGDRPGQIILLTLKYKLIFPFEIYFPTKDLPWYFRLLVNQGLITLLFCSMVIIAFTKNKFSYTTKVILLYFILGTLVSFFARLNFWWWYNDFYSISLLILISIFISYIYQYSKIKFLWIIPLSLFTWCSVFLLSDVYKIDRSPSMPKDATAIILSDLNNGSVYPRLIKLSVYTPISAPEGYEYMYFIKKAGIKVIRPAKAIDADYIIIEGSSLTSKRDFLEENSLKFSEIGHVEYFGHGNTVTKGIILKRNMI